MTNKPTDSRHCWRVGALFFSNITREEALKRAQDIYAQQDGGAENARSLTLDDVKYLATPAETDATRNGKFVDLINELAPHDRRLRELNAKGFDLRLTNAPDEQIAAVESDRTKVWTEYLKVSDRLRALFPEKEQ